jgi:hypothetical protein
MWYVVDFTRKIVLSNGQSITETAKNNLIKAKVYLLDMKFFVKHTGEFALGTVSGLTRFDSLLQGTFEFKRSISVKVGQPPLYSHGGQAVVINGKHTNEDIPIEFSLFRDGILNIKNCELFLSEDGQEVCVYYYFTPAGKKELCYQVFIFKKIK